MNALRIRQSLGKVLELLDTSGEPIIVEKGNRPRAVLVPLRMFLERFQDKTIHEERQAIARWIATQRESKVVEGPPAERLIRDLRGALP